MFRVLIAGIAQEISSFNPVATEYELFSIQRAEEVVEVNRGTRTAIAGAMEIFDSEIDVQFVTTFAAKAVSAGPMSAKCWSTLSTELIDSFRPYVGEVDAIYLSLHGAMGGERVNSIPRDGYSNKLVLYSATIYGLYFHLICTEF